jgi:ATP-binding cassette subfamily C exporter for protease/lipase
MLGSYNAALSRLHPHMFPKLDPNNELDAALIAHRPDFLRAAGLSLFSNLMMLAPSIYMLQVYDRVLTSRNSTTLLMLTLMLLVILAVMGALESARSGILQRVGVNLDQQLGARIFDALLRRNLRAPEGNAIQSLHDLTNLRQFLGGGLVVLFDAPWAPIYILVIALIHPLLGVFALFAAILIFGLALINERITRQPLDEAQKNALRAAAVASGQLRNAEVAEALGMVAGLRARWTMLQDKVLALQALASERGGAIGASTRFVRLASQSLILGLGAWLAIDDLITPGGMIAGSILLGRGLAPVEMAIAQWKAWLSVRSAHERLHKLMADYPTPPPAMPLPPPTGLVTVENVTATPPGSEAPVLKNLAFRINAGDAVGVIGPSAAGKSSLARLLVGLWTPTEGHVRLDAADVSAWDKNELGPYLGYLPQDVELFEGTAAQNIARFGQLESEKVVAAARRAGVHEMILRLPNGYDTPLGPSAGILSAGQRQRIGLARALYGEPRLVVLDEPNASLDDAGQAALAAALLELKQNGVTVVLMTHRRSVLAAVEKLLVLRDGSLVAYGPRDAVLDALSKEGMR